MTQKSFALFSLSSTIYMSKQPNLLAQVRLHLISRGEEYQWVTMGPDSEKIGLAYLPVDATGLPCTFMFTELHEPCSLVFDAYFAELSQLLLTLNANLPEGQLLLDRQGGLVYYRLKYVVDDLNVSEEEISNKVRHMEEMGVRMSVTYARIISQEFPEE